MAISSASAVSTAPAVDNTAKANPSVAAAGSGNAGSFTDSLDAVLAEPGVTNANTSPKNDNDADGASHARGKHTSLKNKLKNGDLGTALTPQMLQQQQAFIDKLENAGSGIDMPALRAAMGQNGQTPAKTSILPSANPLTGKIEAPQPPAANDTADIPDAAAAANATQSAPIPQSPVTDGTAAATNTAAAPTTKNAARATSSAGDQSNDAAHTATQEQLIAALVKTTNTPVLKTGQADGSKVPNTKIAHHANKAAAADAMPNGETVQSLAAKIAATAGATNDPDSAQIAAKSVAVAEVATRMTPATPTVTKIESAAMANATQTATHAPTAQVKIETQALPVQFDAPPANSKDGDANAQSGNGDKSQAQPGSARTTSDVQKQPDAPAPTFNNPQPQAPLPAHTNAAPTDASLTITAANSTSANPITPPQVAVTLHVSPQPLHDAPTDDTTFAALGVAIAAKSKDGDKQFDINMHPAELGRVDVRISVDPDGKTQAHVSAEHPQTLQLLQNDKATLERNLRDAGLDVANNGLSFSLKGEQQSSTPTFNARSRALSIAAVQTADISSASSNANVAPGDARLDIRV